MKVSQKKAVALGLSGEMMRLSEVKPNPDNPRVMKDDKFAKLCKSIDEFPKMMALRPMVTDADGVVLGGNMRLRALQHLGYTSIPVEWVRKADTLTEDETKRFIIEDNVSFGEWDYDALANEWNDEPLNDWGMDVWGEDVNPDDYGEDVNPDDYGEEFNLPNEGKAQYGTMTFVVTDEQREFINVCIETAQYCEGFSDETDNKNANGAALSLITREWFHQQEKQQQEQGKTMEEMRKEYEGLRLYLRDALNKSGAKASDIDKLLGTAGMSGHYFGESQWMWPTREAYEKMKTILPLERDYLECKLIEKRYIKAEKLRQKINKYGTL